jgi:pimeloyl-ACP methyl ester carboxylesterase
VVIAAESMGAGITGQYLLRANNRERVIGLALDAPALDFPAVIEAAGRRRSVPLSDYVSAAALELWRFVRTDLRDAVSLDAVAEFPGPVFVAHGTRDPLVPFSITERLLDKRPDIMLWKTDSDRHPMSFDDDREGYAKALAAWLAAVRATE